LAFFSGKPFWNVHADAKIEMTVPGAAKER
jgi:hypothetical protein